MLATLVVQEFAIIKTLFQQIGADPKFLSNAFFLHYQSFYNRVFDSSGDRKDLENVNFGLKFINECEKFFQSNNTERVYNSGKAVKLVASW